MVINSMEVNFDLYIIAVLSILTLLICFNIYFFSKKIRAYFKSKSRFKFKFKYFVHYIFILNFVFILALLGTGYLFYVRVSPRIAQSSPITEQAWESYNKPIEITFNIPVDKNRLNPNMNPSIEGKWVWEPYFGVQRFTKKGTFYPSQTLFPNQRIVIYLTGIGRVGIKNDNHEGGIVLQSVNLSEVKATYPFHKKQDIHVDESIRILFTKSSENLADLSFKLYPETEIEVVNKSSTEYELIPKSDLQQSTEYNLIIERTPKRIDLNSKETLEKDNPEIIHNLKFTTVKEPFIKTIFPKGTGVKSDAEVKFRFETDVKPESVISNILISPEIPSEFVWIDGRTLVLKPTQPLNKETKYSISIKPGIEGMMGGVSAKSITHEFETIGKIKFDQLSPSNGEVKVNTNANISINFDQEVDKESAQARFTISPGVNGAFSWEGNKLTFDPINLNFGTTYTVNLGIGIRSIYGIDNDQPLSFSFTTRGQEVIISMPWYPQPQSPVSFTCNIVSAQMALAWKGYNTSSSGLINEIGFNSNQSNGRWTGNPYKEYVGCGDGFCGYGVYWTAIQKLFNNRGINTEIKTGFNTSELARSIENGNPVIIWRYNGTSSNGDADWTASDGTYIDAINGQHGGVVTGFRGTVENPIAFYINDPWFGLVWMSRDTFDYYWSRLNRSALVIY